MTPSLSNSGIAARMKDFFERQLAWFSVMHESVSAMPPEIDAARLEQLLEEDGERVRTSRDLELEYHALKREWDEAAGLPDGDVESVRVLARQAEAQAYELHELFEQTAQRAGSDSEAIRMRMGELRQGREWLGKYRQDSSPDSGRIDHQA